MACPTCWNNGMPNILNPTATIILVHAETDCTCLMASYSMVISKLHWHAEVEELDSQPVDFRSPNELRGFFLLQTRSRRHDPGQNRGIKGIFDSWRLSGQDTFTTFLFLCPFHLCFCPFLSRLVSLQVILEVYTEQVHQDPFKIPLPAGSVWKRQNAKFGTDSYRK